MVRRLFDRLTNDLLLKITALGLAFLLCTLVKTDDQVPIDGIPVDVLLQDPDWVIAAEPEPATVRVTFSGPVRELFRVAAERPNVIVPIDRVSDTTEVVLLRTNWVSLGEGLTNTRAQDIRPTAIRLRFERIETKTIPLAIRTIGAPVPGFELDGQPTVEPPTLFASGARSRLAQLDSLRLPPIDLSRRTATDTLELAIDTTGLGIVLTPREVRVVVPIRPVVSDTTTTPPSFPGPPDPGR